MESILNLISKFEARFYTSVPQKKCEAENTTNTLISLVEIGNFQSDSLVLMPEAEIQKASNEEIDPESLEDELTSGTLAILARIETFDEYFHCCGRW